MQSAEEHPHGLSDRVIGSLSIEGKPIIFNFHRYTCLIHRVANLCTNHRNLHVRGHNEKCNINIPLELAIDIISRVPVLQLAGAHAKEKLRGMQLDYRACAHSHDDDMS